MASLRNQNGNQRLAPAGNHPIKPAARKPLGEHVIGAPVLTSKPAGITNRGNASTVQIRQDEAKKTIVAPSTQLNRLPTLSSLKDHLPLAKRQRTLHEIVRTAGKENGFINGVRERPADVDDIYRDDLDNESVVVAYVEHIYAYLLGREVPRLSVNYMDGMSINSRMRAILIDWVVSVVYKFKMCQDMLYLAVDIIDRFLAIPNLDITKDELQLVGVTAMFIASKFEEVYPPELDDYVFISDNACTKEQILHTEMVMSNALNFDFTRPCASHFIRRCTKAAMYNSDEYSMVKYICELALLPIEFVEIRPSLTAAAATYLVMIMRRPDDMSWDSSMEYYAFYSEREVKPIAAKLLKLVDEAPNCRQQCIYKKYNHVKNHEAALLCQDLIPEAKKHFIV